MKILYIITQGELGGAQRYVRDLAREFSNSGHEIIVANGATGDQWLLEQLSDKNIKRHQFRNLVREINPAKDLSAFFEIKKYVKAIRPDIIHARSTKPGILVAFAKGKTASIYTVHGWVFNEPMNWLRRQLYIFLEKMSSRQHEKIIVLGEHDKNIALRLKIASAKKLAVVPHGIQHDENQKSKIKNQNDGISIVTIANFYKTKGLIYLITAVKHLAKIIPHLRLTIFGDGPERSLLQQKIDKHPSITLLGRVPNATNQLSDFDIFVLPSLKEGFPYVILEAMSKGIPIVATVVGEIPNILENEVSALLVEPANSEALAKAIQKMVDNPLLRISLADAAKKRLADFSFESMIKKHHRLYLELTSNS